MIESQARSTVDTSRIALEHLNILHHQQPEIKLQSSSPLSASQLDLDSPDLNRHARVGPKWKKEG
ncbi:hypothetical protein CBOM_07967 [Ceraceosorus bombacis]|uniref:Uncharacterized protein n=1 Tax=Ceraceosorus bombacis TaxID=401625 RepID=A0A0P1BB35_9BASI|nr:hypothetical protein CBOM_07967 [Ceraceosorus bombacis]